MKVTLAFDVYGTLINTHDIVTQLDSFIGNKAHNFSLAWRNKQLEYSFRRGLMNQYQPFSVCTAQALDFTCEQFSTPLTYEQKSVLLNAYRHLPIYKDVAESLKLLKEAGFRLYAFSNGSSKEVSTLLAQAGIFDFFIDIISVESLKTFKPSPETYHYFLDKSAAVAEHTWLVSSNSFDIVGAHNVGFNTAWVQRSKRSVFDPWDVEPSMVVNDLLDLFNKIS